MSRFLYIASQDAQGGILRCNLSPDGQLETAQMYPLDRVAYLCAEGDRLYALMREPFQMQSGVAEFRILPDGSLEPIGEIQPVHGTIAAHIYAREGRIYTANYLSGTTTLLPDRLLAHNGRSVNPERQTCSHPHCITPTPDGKFLCINDLGTDCIYVCTPELEEVSRVCVPAGAGPRHLVFSPDGKTAFCSNEMGASVSVFSYEDGRLTHLGLYSTCPDNYTGWISASAIRISPEGDRLYVSNRGHNSAAIFEIEGTALKSRRFLPVQGDSPREMTIAGDFLLFGNENSHTVTVFSRKTEEHLSTFPVTRPWCILPAER